MSGLSVIRETGSTIVSDRYKQDAKSPAASRVFAMITSAAFG